MPIIHMASKLEDIPADAVNVRDVTEQWKDSCAEEYRDKYKLFLYDTHVGLCIRDYERNGYNDSDWYMIIWNPVEKRPETLEFASTRGWSYPCYGSKPDATPEILAAYQAWEKEYAESQRRALEAAEAKLPKVGRAVRVVKGRKLPKGTVGRVFWTGCNQFRTYYRNGYNQPNQFERLGIQLEDGSKVFMAGANVEVVAVTQ